MRNFHRQKSNFIKKFFVAGASGQPDYFLVGLIFFIVIFGLVMLSSASSVESFRRWNDTYYLFKHQIINGFLPGLVAFFVLAKIDYKYWQKKTLWFLAVSIILLILVFMPGLRAGYSEAKSWINIFGISIQSSEIVKLLLILFFAGWFAQRGEEMNKNIWNGLAPFAVILGIISLLIVEQPDLGTLIILILTSLAIYFVAGGQIKHLAGLGLLGIVAVAILIAKAPYRAARLVTFLNPALDPSGQGYHINQAFLAIGSGGWLGLGFGQSLQKFAYLPEVIGDSIFAVIAEEIGFIFSVFLIGLFVVLLFRGFKLAQQTNDNYARYIITGIMVWFTLQAFINIAAMLGLVPLTGVPLPFVSYGGTALISAMAAAGILVNISKHV